MPQFKLLVFGATGFVGQHVVKKAQEGGVQVIAVSRKHVSANPSTPSTEFRQCDLSHPASVMALIQETKPNTVIHAAGISGIDEAQNNPDLAYEVNVNCTKHIALACSRNQIRLILLSTDAVFGDNLDRHAENELPSPVNVYGQTKSEAEQVCSQTCKDYVIVRPCLILGYPIATVNCFYVALERSLRSGKAVLVATDENRSPVDVHTLTEALLELTQSNYVGKLHVASKNFMNRFALSQILAEKMGFQREQITQLVTTNERAPRHKNGILDVSLAAQILKTPMLSVEEGIERTFSHPSVSYGKTNA